ncbi:RNA-directed DNA polymerase from mobile element jockey [Trichonephila clavipes]|nr:RNA-directed DNA polymerase from mobile element jockey [Trichonephila clavipes]
MITYDVEEGELEQDPFILPEDLAICSPSLLPHLNLSVEKNLYNSDHFPVILSHDSDPAGKTCPSIHRVWQETWDQQVLNKLHSIHPSISHWAALPVRRHDVRLTRLRIGHTRFTHRHLLLGENAPEVPRARSHIQLFIF